MTRCPLATLLILGLALGALPPPPAGAQTATTSVAGTVTGPDGARIPFATVTLTDPVSGRSHTRASDGRGLFLFDEIPAATYDLVVSAAGYAPRTVAGLDVPPGATHRVTITLAPASLAEMITVTAAMPRDSLEQTAVRESAARDVGEALAATAGVWRVRRGAIANDVVVRGLASRDLNVLIDGQRVYGACPNRMDPPAFHVDFSEVERVEVGKGPFDVRYQGSMGGLVNIVTRRPADGWHASPTLSVGSFGFVNPSASISYGGARLALLGGYSFRRSAPYVDGRGERFTAVANYRPDQLDAEAFRATTAWARAAWRLADGGQVEASYTRQQADQMLYPYLQMDAMYDNADRVAVRLDQPRAGARVSAVRVDLTWSRVDHWMTDALRRSATGAPRDYSMATDALTSTFGGRAEAQVGASLTVGGEAYRRRWDTTTMMAGMNYMPQASIPDATIDAVGVFAEYRRALGTRTTLDAGARIDRMRSAADAANANLALFRAYHATTTTARTDVVPAGRVKLSHQIAPAVLASASLGHTARVAEPNERFFALRRMGSDWVGNPDLAPARNTGADLSVTVDHRGRSLSVNGFVTRLHDYVMVYTARRLAMVAGVMNATARSYTGVDGWLRGVEIVSSAPLGPLVTVASDVSYTRGTFASNGLPGVTGGDLAEMPPLRASARVRVDNGRAFGEVATVAAARQRRVDTALGEAETPGYAIVNVHGGLRMGQVAISAGVANLFDRYYVEHLSFQRDPFRSGVRLAEPGRHLFMNASWKF